MSLYRIALIVFLVATGLLFIFDLGRVTEVVAGIAAFVVAALLIFDGDRTTRV